MLTCYLVDDQPHTIELLELYIGLSPQLKLIGIENDPEIALDRIHSERPDITFLDIEMPGLSGLQIAEMVRQKTNIILVSGHREYGPEAYALEVVDYLLKPFTHERFLQAIEKATQRLMLKLHKAPYLFIQDVSKNMRVRVVKEDILYIMALPNYSKIVTQQTQYLSYLTLKGMLELLADGYFVRVHKSFVVNIQKIAALIGNYIQMENKEQIPIGRLYKDQFLKIIEG